MRNLGPGSEPGLAVDNEGTAYVAWNGPENPSTLRFCRFPRGGAACAAGLATSISTIGNSLTRPFVFVNGSRIIVLSYRYPQSGTDDFRGTYAYTSPDGGASFGPGVKVGPVPFFEMATGPGDTMSGVTDALSSGMVFQNLPAGGGFSEDVAVLSGPTDHPYAGSVGLVDAGTPIAVFTAADRDAQYRMYDGSGIVNDVANWTAPVALGYAAYPKLASGPRGLYMTAGNAMGMIIFRHLLDSRFPFPISLGAGDPARQHFFQDAGGRLHMVVQRGDASGLHLRYWVTDTFGQFRSMNVASQDPGVAGAFNSPRLATAADHIGFAVWQASTAGDIRIVPVGP